MRLDTRLPEGYVEKGQVRVRVTVTVRVRVRVCLTLTLTPNPNPNPNPNQELDGGWTLPDSAVTRDPDDGEAFFADIR